MAKRWEYKIVNLDPKGSFVTDEAKEELLNTLGQEGWELITIFESATAYLKREVD